MCHISPLRDRLAVLPCLPLHSQPIWWLKINEASAGVSGHVLFLRLLGARLARLPRSRAVTCIRRVTEGQQPPEEEARLEPGSDSLLSEKSVSGMGEGVDLLFRQVQRQATRGSKGSRGSRDFRLWVLRTRQYVVLSSGHLHHEDG